MGVSINGFLVLRDTWSVNTSVEVYNGSKFKIYKHSAYYI